jgi:hypothetical protein
MRRAPADGNDSLDVSRASMRSAHALPARCYLFTMGSGETETGAAAMSQAFLRDDAEGEMPRRDYNLPARDDPEFDRVAARALLEAARVNETQLAERATGYYWGEPRLREHVADMLVEAERANDERLEQLARRFLG